MRQIVHLKLCRDFPPEVQGAAVVRDEGERCSVVIQIKDPERVFQLAVPFSSGTGFNSALAALGAGWPPPERLAEPAYRRFIDALRKLALEMRPRITE